MARWALTAIGGNLRLGPAAKVGGDVVAVGGLVERDAQASVGGEVSSTPIPVFSRLPLSSLGRLLLVGLLVGGALNLVLVLLSYLIARERRVEVIASTVRARAGLALLTGVGVLVGTILLFIIFSRMGPLTPALATLVSVALVITLVMGYTGICLWLGRSLARGRGPLVAILLGAVLITVLQLIPLLGLFAFLVFFLLALGSAALSGYGSAMDWLPQRFAGRPIGPPPSPPRQ